MLSLVTFNHILSGIIFLSASGLLKYITRW
nr:MAG TPA: hypothetical protein [Caudoviricetes sp.]